MDSSLSGMLIWYEQSAGLQERGEILPRNITNTVTMIIRYFLYIYKMVSCFKNVEKEKLSDLSIINWQLMERPTILKNSFLDTAEKWDKIFLCGYENYNLPIKMTQDVILQKMKECELLSTLLERMLEEISMDILAEPHIEWYISRQ